MRSLAADISGVYPRTRGATSIRLCPGQSMDGLSPHARGNHDDGRHCGRWRGSIPARAGQPSDRPSTIASITVYPRTRGATLATLYGTPVEWGLSPHARGNRDAGSGFAQGPGSIPARAGQPAEPTVARAKVAVYPRTSGATMAIMVNPTKLNGLSPHARGNQSLLPRQPGPGGSIPARAGQPRIADGPEHRGGVYPRTRGATHTRTTSPQATVGLSPHARGNRISAQHEPALQGSIPARAGQPTLTPRTLVPDAVYPRTRGATSPWPLRRRRLGGLSPHARGNPDTAHRGCRGQGSIPARAGQPGLHRQ